VVIAGYCRCWRLAASWRYFVRAQLRYGGTYAAFLFLCSSPLCSALLAMTAQAHARAGACGRRGFHLCACMFCMPNTPSQFLLVSVPLQVLAYVWWSCSLVWV
jgi:hypothetical protein